MYLVTGGTGSLGRHVVQGLKITAAPVRVLSRRPRTGEDGVEQVVGDLGTGAGLAKALAGVTAIVHCATEPTNRGADVRGTARLIEAAQAAGGAPLLVYIGIVGSDRIGYPYYRDKVAAEALIQKSALPWTILRTTQFHELMAFLCGRVSRSLVMPVLSGASFQPIAATEVADRLVELAQAPAQGRVEDMGGPEVRPFRDLARAYLRAHRKRRLLVPVRVPGALGIGYRAGYHLTPEHAVGRTTFDEYLRRSVG